MARPTVQMAKSQVHRLPMGSSPWIPMAVPLVMLDYVPQMRPVAQQSKIMGILDLVIRVLVSFLIVRPWTVSMMNRALTRIWVYKNS